MLTPANLFIECWESGRRMSGSVVNHIMLPSDSFKIAVNDTLMIPNGEESYLKLKSIWGEDGSGAAKGRMLVIIRAIDSFFHLVHPRELYSASAWAKIPLTHWIRAIKLHRYDHGNYACNQEYRVIPKGPLTRDCRDEFASSAYSFADQFEFLAVAAKEVSNDMNPITVNMTVHKQEWAKGVGPANSNGSESVAFVPIAQLPDHLTIVEKSDKNQHYVDFSLSSPLDAAMILKSRIDDFGYADIVIAPELVVNESAADRLQVLIHSGTRQARLIVAGSGATTAQQDGVSWNETRIINGRGNELWRQRKVWQAGLNGCRAQALGLRKPPSGLVMENNHAGDEIVIADVDGFGRCLVLICQDIQANPLAPELIRQYQPDWVFVPILDSGIDIARWAHQRAYELSALSPARFLIASSTSMAELLSLENVPCGLALGPKNSIGPDAGRMLSTVKAHQKPHGHGILVWRSEGWKKTIMTAI